MPFHFFTTIKISDVSDDRSIVCPDSLIHFTSADIHCRLFSSQRTVYTGYNCNKHSAVTSSRFVQCFIVTEHTKILKMLRSILEKCRMFLYTVN